TDEFGGSSTGTATVDVKIGRASCRERVCTSEAITANTNASITGISLSELGHTSTEKFTVSVSDIHGTLGVSSAGGATVAASGTSLTISGTFDQVNTALGNLTDNDSNLGKDTISFPATDEFGGSSTGTATVDV